jgi:para-aminobenzoate synthetase/4-amino-4-deoxychorismate lyase
VAPAYRRLAAAQRGAHHALLRSPERSVLCASPELFFALDGRRLVSRPMKGTARRGAPAGGPADRLLAAGLLGSPKERAENVMIVDLVRNDVGRLAEIGSVTVPALCTVEAFPTVWQLTSTVTGRVPAGTGVAACFRALFPPGSVTGAPKTSAARAIAELERSPRGVYCGAVGWAGPGPSGPRARFAVAIRTLVVEHATGEAVYGVGGGITWASTAAEEWAECRAKAAVLGALDGPDGAPAPAPGGVLHR